jgi:hypothetical protein
LCSAVCYSLLINYSNAHASSPLHPPTHMSCEIGPTTPGEGTAASGLALRDEMR